MPKIIDIEGVGPVEFDDDITEAEILVMSKKLMADAPVTHSLRPALSEAAFKPQIGMVAPPEMRQHTERAMRESILAERQPRLGDVLPEPFGFSQSMIPLPDAPRFTQELKDIPFGAYPSLVASAAYNKLFKPTAEFAMSPLGVVAGGTASMGPLAARLVGTGFFADMTRQMPEVARRAGEISVTGSPQEKLESALELGFQAYVPTHAGYGAFRPRGLGNVIENQARAFEQQPFSQAVDVEAQEGALPIRQIGTRLANVLEDPMVKPVVERALQETTPAGRIIKPGQRRALTELQELAYPEEHVAPPEVAKVIPGGEATRTLERPGGGSALGGKVSFAAEAPGMTSVVPKPEVPLSEQARLMQQSFVPAKGTAAFEAQKGDPNATSVRSDQRRLPEEGVQPKGSETTRGEDLQRQQTGKEEPGASRVQGQKGITIPEPKGPPKEAGGFLLPGPELIRTLSGFKNTATVAGQQLYNRVKNLITPDEMKAYDDAGFKAFMSRPRSPDDVAKWMEENGPKVEVKTFDSQTIANADVAEAQRMIAEANHKFDTAAPDWRIGEGNFLTYKGEQFQPLGKHREVEMPKVVEEAYSKLRDFEDAGVDIQGNPTALNPDQWRGVASKDAPQKMVVVRVPFEKANDADLRRRFPNANEQQLENLRKVQLPSQAMFRGGHLGSEDINVLGWTRGHDEVVGGKKVTVLDEQQGDWGQPYEIGTHVEGDPHASRWRYKGQPANENSFATQAEARKAGYAAHPLLKEAQRLTLKAQIEQSLKEGKEAIVVPDDKTVMLSEGHDAQEVLIKVYSSPEEAVQGVKDLHAQGFENSLDIQGNYSDPKLVEAWPKTAKERELAVQNGFAPAQAGGMRQNYDPLYSILDRHGNVIAKETFADAESAHAFAQNRTAGLGLREGQYDVSRGILHDIMEELTGVKGEPVDMGPHQNALDRSKVESQIESPDLATNPDGPYKVTNTRTGEVKEFKTHDEAYAYADQQRPARPDLVLRNPDGSLKVNATGRLYDLSKVAQRKEPFRMFGTDKLSEAKVGEASPGIKIKLGERGESGAIVLPPILKKIVDAMTPKKGATLTDAEVEYGTKGPVIMFRSYDTEKKIATSPQGIGKIPGLGQVFDPRSKAKTPVMQAILAGQQMTFKGKQIATLFLEATKTSPRAFLEDDAGNATLASGHKAPTSNIVRREIANPGSQPLTPDQRQFVIMWRTLRKGLVDYARSEGVTKVLDDQGSTVNLSKWSFPTSSYFDEVSGTIKREKDAYVRVSKFMEAIYSAIAAQRMSRDPALRGRPASSGPMRLDEGGSFVPWARGRIFPKAVADQINRYYGAQPHSFARNLTDVNDVLKAVKFTLDVSAPFNQGLIMMARHPIRWAHAAARSYAAIADPNQFSKYLQPRMQDAIEFVTHGGSLGSLQDFLIGARAEGPLSRIPVVKDILHPAIKRSAESMNTFLSIGKLEMYRALKQSVPVKDLPKLVEAVENLMLSGRMEAIGLTPARNLAERLLFNAPSYLRGAANIVASLPQGGLQGKLALKALGTLAGSLSITMLGLYKMDGMSNEEIKERFDPGNSKFLKYPLKLANGDVLEVGPGNAILQMARLIGNVYDVVMDKKPGGSGVEGNPFIRWMSYRSSPLVQLGIQVYTGKDYLWRDISAKEAAGRAMLPISIEQFFSSEKLGTRAAESGFSLVGLQSYPENFTATRNRLQNEAAETLFKKPYDQLLPYERAQVTDEIKPQMEQKRKETGPPSLAFIEKMDKARKERMTESLQPEQQTFLQQHGLSLPGYRLQDTVRGTDVFFTKEEEVRYEKYLIEEYKVAIDRLRESEDFADVSQKAKETRFDRLTTMARERAKRRLQLEIRGDQ